MSQPHPLEAVEVRSMSRHALLLRGALAAGAVYGSTAVSPFLRRAFAQGGMGDVDVVNFALTLEYLETAFYEQGAKLGLSSDVRSQAKRFGAEEAEHVDALTATVRDLGGTPADMPTFDFGITDERSFLALAQTLEDTGVGAYNGAGPSIRSKEVLAAAGSIVQVEARHAAVIRLLRDQQPAPSAFDKPLTTAQVNKAVAPLIVG